jgi:hypothetical protein
LRHVQAECLRGLEVNHQLELRRLLRRQVGRSEVVLMLAARNRLPAVYPFRIFVASGGLMSYGIDTTEILRRSGLRRPYPQRQEAAHLRGLLYEAAAVILTRSSTDSTLRTWGLKLRERIGFKRAAVAVARKLPRAGTGTALVKTRVESTMMRSPQGSLQ